jgi:CheY-like chemotaxis protein
MRPALPPGAARPILVVDDDATIRRLLFWALTDEGYAVLEASDGAIALVRVQATAPSLILLDMRMPRMDGWEFARRYRQLPAPHAPLVCLTAAVDAAARGAQIGAVATLGKPFDLDALLAVVRRHVAAPV